MAEGDTVVNAAIGAVASVVLSGIVPFGPLFGGGVAGYLQGGDRSAGVRVGALAGAIALVPAMVIGLLMFGFVATMFLGSAVEGAPGLGALGALGLFGLFAFFVFGLLYFVGLSAAGGWLGNYVKYDTDVEL